MTMATTDGARARLNGVFHALGDPTRRAIVEMLGERPRSLSELAAPLGVTVTAVAQHIQVLEANGLAMSKKVGRVRACQIDDAGFEFLQHWIGAQRQEWARRLDRLGDVLAEEE